MKKGGALVHVQGVSENMQKIFTSTKIGCKPRRIKVIYQIQAYNHKILLIIKNPENNTKEVHYDVINEIPIIQTRSHFRDIGS